MPEPIVCSICGANLKDYHTTKVRKDGLKIHDHRCIVDVLEDILKELKRSNEHARIH